MSHSSLLENGHGEKKSNEVNFCELFPCVLFGTFIHDIYICIVFVGLVSKVFLLFTNDVYTQQCLTLLFADAVFRNLCIYEEKKLNIDDHEKV